MELSLLAAAAVSTAAFWLTIRWEAKRGNAAGCAVSLWDTGLTAAMTGVFVGRLVAMASVGINPLTDPGQILLVRSGVSTVGATLGGLAMFAWLARRDVISIADAIAPAAVAALAGWHAGCLATAGCLGTESSLPWAMTIDGSTITRHPVELYAALLLAGAALGLVVWKQHGRPPLGMVTGVAVASASGVRLVTEPLRISLDGGPSWFYAAGLVIGLVATVVAWSRRPIRQTSE
jgi:prolipoprotein diacylglyceryltransferase